jgi:Ca2+-transporting ATPase
MAQLINVFNMPKRQESFFVNEVTRNFWVWGALFLSLLITLGAYLIPPVARSLSLQPLGLELLVTAVLFAFGSMVLAQLIKRLGRAF